MDEGSLACEEPGLRVAVAVVDPARDFCKVDLLKKDAAVALCEPSNLLARSLEEHLRPLTDGSSTKCREHAIVPESL